MKLSMVLQWKNNTIWSKLFTKAAKVSVTPCSLRLELVSTSHYCDSRCHSTTTSRQQFQTSNQTRFIFTGLDEVVGIVTISPVKSYIVFVILVAAVNLPH
jgi:hypothetical protein